jgi:hypothetical protein
MVSRTAGKQKSQPMKSWSRTVCISAAFLAASCGEKKQPAAPKPPQEISAIDLKPPENPPPPVETKPYEDGFAAGVKAGEAAGKARTRKAASKIPSEQEIEVEALEAAGTNPDRGAKWQRGFVSGYRDGFGRAAMGIR